MAEGWSRKETALGACGCSANARSSLSGSHGSSSGLWAKRTEVPGLAGELALLAGHGWQWHHKYIPRTFKNKGHGKESRKKQENRGSESGGILSKDHIVFLEE